MNYSPACIALVKLSEDEPGFLANRCTHLKAYKCPAGCWTCGWGTTSGVTAETEFTQEEADRRLAVDLDEAAAIVNKWVTPWVTLTQNQFDALTSFVQNIGPGRVGEKDGFVWLKRPDKNGQPVHSTLLRKLVEKDPTAPWEFGKWVHAGGAVLSGLIVRRAREVELFQKPEEPVA